MMEQRVALIGKVRLTLASAIAAVACAALTATTVGCTQQQQIDTKVVVAKIAQYEPEAQLAIDTIASVVATLSPADAIVVNLAMPIVDTDLVSIKTLCATYAATPNTGTLNSIKSTIEAMLSQNADQFLAANKISDPKSVASVKVALAGFRTILLLMDGAMQATQTPAQIAATAQSRNLKLKELEPYFSPHDKQQIEAATGHSFHHVMAYEESLGF
jgi:hypothetical protein